MQIIKQIKFIFKIFFGCIVIIHASYAQQNWLWHAGGNGNDEALDNTTDANNNVYTTGYFSLPSEFGNQSLNSSGSGDVFISKQSPDGTFLWTAKAGGASSDRGFGISTDPAGNVYVTGTFTGTAVFGSYILSSYNGSQDVFVAKLDLNGNFIWVKHLGGTDIDLVASIVTDATGNSVIAGSYKGTFQADSYTFSSAINPLNQLPSYDIFIARLDSSGNVLWAKNGSAPYDDRSLDLTADNSGNIYLAGQFSGTLTFTNTYSNAAYNVCFVLKMDEDGNETWLRKFLASQITIYGICTDGYNIYATGNFDGQLTISGANGTSLNSSYPYKIFVAKLDSAGNAGWSVANGSFNPVSSYDVSADNTGNCYILGNFECIHSEYSQLYDSAVFNSIGFNDVFVAKFNSSGVRSWERHFGSAGQDYGAAISLNLNNAPVIAGSFEKYLNVPASGNFIYNSSNATTLGLGPLQYSGYCTDNNYPEYVSTKSNGNKDIFSAIPVDSMRAPYDYYDRLASSCQRDILLPYINNNEDTVEACDSVLIFATTRTGKDGIIGPSYDYFWSNGKIKDSIYVDSSGWYFLDLSFKDGCRSYRDSVFVNVLITPPVPEIVSSIWIIEQAIPDSACLNKINVIFPDFPILSCVNVPPGYDVYWITPDGDTIFSDSVLADTTGVYEITIQTTNGLCWESACVEVFIYKQGTGGQCLPDPLFPEIHFLDSDADITDTVKVCRGYYFDVVLIDSIDWVDNKPPVLNTYVYWSIAGGFSMDPYESFETSFIYHLQRFRAWSSGYCSISCIIEHPITLQPFDTVIRNFYLLVYPSQNLNPHWYGPGFFCPGDTAMMILTGGGNNVIDGPGIAAISQGKDTIWVNQPGIYTAKCYYEDSLYGCLDSAFAIFEIETSPQPMLTLDPPNGLICPGDSVKLEADTGSNFHWYGPLGELSDSSKSIYVSAPGFYYYDFNDKFGCPLVSEFKELTKYTTPDISVNPGSVLCEGDSIILTVETNDTTNLSWQNPFSGSSFSQVVYTPGTYYCDITSCGNTITDSVVITPSTLQAEIIPPGPLPLCPGDTLELSANPGMVQYIWVPSTSDSAVFLATNPGLIVLEVTDINSCTSLDSIIIDSLPQPLPPLVADTVLCALDSTNLVAEASGIILWYVSPGADTPLFVGDTFFTAFDSTIIFYLYVKDSICMSNPDSLIVTVNQGSLPPAIKGDSVLCPQDSLTLTAIAPGEPTFHWTGPEGFSSDSITIIIFPFDSSKYGTYNLQVSDSICSSSISTYFVDIFPKPEVQIFSTDTSLCQYDSALVFTNQVFSNYLWLPEESTSNVINVTGNQDVYLIVSDSNGCKDTSDIIPISTVIVDLPVINDTSICLDSIVTLHAQGSGTVFWYDSTFTFLDSGSTYTSPVITNPIKFYINQSGEQGCRSDFDSILINIFPLLQEPVIYSNNPVCEGDSIYFYTDIFPTAMYLWSGPGFASSTPSNYFMPASSSQNGNYFLRYFNYGCENGTVSFEINIIPYPQFDSITDTIICAGLEFITSIPDSFDAYYWTNGSYTNDFETTVPGLFTVTAINYPNCSTDMRFQVDTMSCIPVVPTIITPNGDGKNDDFYIADFYPKEFTIQIFNRWGEIIVEISPQNYPWNGRNNKGNNVSSGVYYYLLRYTDYLDKTYEYPGYFHVER